MENTLLNTLAGAFILLGVLRVYKTVNTFKFIGTLKLTVFVFLAFTLGLSLSDPTKGRELVRFVLYNNGFAWIGWLSPLAIPIVFLISKGHRLKNSMNDTISEFWPPIGCLVLVFALTVYGVTGEPNENKIHLYFSFLPYLISISIFAALIHSIAGPILFGINLGLVASHFLSTGLLSVTLLDLFDGLSTLGIVSDPVKWVILAVSALLGLHGILNLAGIKEKVFD